MQTTLGNESPVESAWSVDGPGARHRVIPDGRANLIFKEGTRTRLYVAGPLRTALSVDMQPTRRTVGVRLRPGVLSAVIGVPAGDVRDTTVELVDVWRPHESRRLADRLRAEPDASARRRLLVAAVLRRVPTPPSRATDLVSWTVNALDAEPSQRIAALAERAGVSARHLRRVFHERVGLAPKTYARIRRVRRAIRDAGPEVDWASLAARHGFADQAHLCREFGRVLGHAPTAWLDVRFGQDRRARTA